MNIIKIGDYSMKISLCANEAQRYSLNDQELKQDKIKSAFIQLLLKARERINFRLLSDKIMAEIFSGKDGGCEIFISQVEVRESMYKERNVTQEIPQKTRALTSIYLVDSIENLISIFERLEAINYDGASSVYYDEDGQNYYVMLEGVSYKELKFAFLNEYARFVKGSPTTYIKEHYKCICKRNAVKVFSHI